MLKILNTAVKKFVSFDFIIRHISKLRKNQEFMKYFRNTSWMFAEQGVKIVSAVFVGIYIARYLGPEQFGLLSYAIAVVAVLAAITRLGMDSILVRELVVHPEDKQQYIGTAFGLMLIASIIGVVIVAGVIGLIESDPQTKIYIWIISVGLIFQTLLVIDYAFQSQVKAKYSSIAKSVALSLSALIKICLVIFHADLLLFVLSYAFDHVLIALSLLIMYLTKQQPSFLFIFNAKLVKPLLKSAWPMVMSAVSIILYMRIDQIMIKNMLDSEQVGLYAAMTRVYEGWIMIPVILCASLLPAIVKMKSISQIQYEKRLILLFSIVFWLSMIVAVITALFSDVIINLTFGSEYAAASSVLVVIMWSSSFAALGSVTYRYLIAENMEKKIAVRTFVALAVNVTLNFILIPLYGIEGAAVATLVCIITANYLIDYLDSDLKQLIGIKNNALLIVFSFKRGKDGV